MTGNVPATELVQDRVETPDVPRVIEVGFRVHNGVPLADRFTVPWKPFREVTLIVEVPATPVCVVTDDGLAEMLKSFRGKNSDILLTPWSHCARSPRAQLASSIARVLQCVYFIDEEYARFAPGPATTK